MAETASARAVAWTAATSTVSFEFFPPKNEKMEETLWTSIRRLEPMRPDFVSVTYGAGGSTRERTHATVVAHRARDDGGARRASDLRGGHARARWMRWRAPTGRPASAISWRCAAMPLAGPGTKFEPHPDGYQNAADLVAGLKRLAEFEISVAAYPEKHPDSPSVDADIDNLKAKIDAGATPRHHPVLLRQRGSSCAISTACAPEGITVPDRAGHRADPQFQAGGRVRRAHRRAPFPTGWRAASRASTTTRRPRTSWPPPSPPSRSWTSSITASASSISTR